MSAPARPSMPRSGKKPSDDPPSGPQDKALVRVEPQEESGLMVLLGAEFHPPAVPEPPPEAILEEQPEEDEPQPMVAGQPTARTPKPKTPC